MIERGANPLDNLKIITVGYVREYLLPDMRKEAVKSLIGGKMVEGPAERFDSKADVTVGKV